jgi:acetylglutamate kinase
VTSVVKIGGRVQSDPRLGPRLVDVANATSGGLVIVHGGGDEVSSLQRRMGLEPRFIGGRRVTTREELEIVRMVLSGSTNKRLVSLFRAAGLRAVGISGEDGGLLQAHVAEGAPLGCVGERTSANASILQDLLASGWVPVVSPLAEHADEPASGGLNVNGDDAATAIAIAIGATELTFIADVTGVLVDGVFAPTLTTTDARELIRVGVAVGGMAAKLDAGCAALERGVLRVRITDLAGLANNSRGTTLLSATTPVTWPR